MLLIAPGQRGLHRSWAPGRPLPRRRHDSGPLTRPDGVVSLESVAAFDGGSTARTARLLFSGARGRDGRRRARDGERPERRRQCRRARDPRHTVAVRRPRSLSRDPTSRGWHGWPASPTSTSRIWPHRLDATVDLSGNAPSTSRTSSGRSGADAPRWRGARTRPLALSRPVAARLDAGVVEIVEPTRLTIGDRRTRASRSHPPRSPAPSWSSSVDGPIADLTALAPGLVPEGITAEGTVKRRSAPGCAPRHVPADRTGHPRARGPRARRTGTGATA